MRRSAKSLYTHLRCLLPHLVLQSWLLAVKLEKRNALRSTTAKMTWMSKKQLRKIFCVKRRRICIYNLRRLPNVQKSPITGPIEGFFFSTFIRNTVHGAFFADRVSSAVSPSLETQFDSRLHGKQPVFAIGIVPSHSNCCIQLEHADSSFV